MSDDDSFESEIEYLTEQVREELDSREDVASFEIRPAETVGVVATVKTDAGTEYYHVTSENRPEGDQKIHWSSLGGEPDI